MTICQCMEEGRNPLSIPAARESLMRYREDMERIFGGESVGVLSRNPQLLPAAYALEAKMVAEAIEETKEEKDLPSEEYPYGCNLEPYDIRGDR